MSLIKILFLFSIFTLFFACSSSSIERRYNHSHKEKEEKGKHQRFSSANDEETFRAEFDEEPVEDYPVNVKEFVEKNDTIGNPPIKLSKREKVMMEIVKYLNTPYLYGGNNKLGIDCSAFTQNVFQNSLNIKLPRTAREQFVKGEIIKSKKLLRFGDLIFFDTTKNSYPGHVGIYLGDYLFAHASFSKGVTVSSLQSSYFNTRYVGARREVKIGD
jgi:cell wall-associated NlpC family hydrolase